MYCASSKEFFEIAIGPQPENSLGARLLCLGDFLKRLLLFPLALAGKLCKTGFRVLGIGFSAFFLLITLGSVQKARELFIERIVVFAKDVGDWILLPFALLLCLVRLFLALLIHPGFYFNAV
jgi:hypothetical protein